MNIWDEELFVPVDPPASPSMNNTVGPVESPRERPSFSSTNSVSSFFFPPTDESPSRKTKTYNHFNTISSLSRLSIAPSLLSPNKDKHKDNDKLDPRHSTIVSKSKPSTPTHLSPEVSRQVSPATTFPPTKNKKHAWVFPKLNRKGGTAADTAVPNTGATPSDDPAQASVLATSLNQIIQSLTPANTVPCMFFALFLSPSPYLLVAQPQLL